MLHEQLLYCIIGTSHPLELFSSNFLYELKTYLLEARWRFGLERLATAPINSPG